MPERNEKIANKVKELAAEFLSRAGNRSSLITVTSANCSPDLKNATIYITVLPENKEQAALMFVKRNLGEFRDYLKENLSTKTIPFLEVELDLGEKNRQKIDELLRKP